MFFRSLYIERYGQPAEMDTRGITRIWWTSKSRLFPWSARAIGWGSSGRLLLLSQG